MGLHENKISTKQKNLSAGQTNIPQNGENLYQIYVTQRANIQDLQIIAEIKRQIYKTVNQQMC